jgi:hypothetical protein
MKGMGCDVGVVVLIDAKRKSIFDSFGVSNQDYSSLARFDTS